MSLSFSTAKDLRSRSEILPSGPEWQYCSITPKAPTKSPLFLYYRDPLQCLEDLIRSPLVKDFVKFSPFQLFTDAASSMRVYTEWLSGDRAWEMQVD